MMASPSPSKPKKNDLRVIGEKKKEGYRFIDKDPDMDMVIAAIGNSGLSSEKIEELTVQIGRKVSASTIIGWTYGKTKRPQNFTLNSVMIALGYEREWRKDGEVVSNLRGDFKRD